MLTNLIISSKQKSKLKAKSRRSALITLVLFTIDPLMMATLFYKENNPRRQNNILFCKKETDCKKDIGYFELTNVLNRDTVYKSRGVGEHFVCAKIPKSIPSIP